MAYLVDGVSITGALHNFADTNSYTAYLRAGETYEFYMGGDANGDAAYIHNPHLTIQGFGQTVTNDDGGDGLDAIIRFTPTVSGNYTVTAGATGTSDVVGKYDLEVSDRTLARDLPDHGGSTAEFRADPRLAIGDILYSDIFAGDSDLVQVQLVAGTSYTIDARAVLAGNLLDPQLWVRNLDGQALAFDNDSGDGENARVVFTPTTSGTYYLQVEGGQTMGGYELEVLGSGADAVGGSISPLSPTVTLADVVRGRIDGVNDTDVYAVQLAAGVKYILYMDGGDPGDVATMSLQLLDRNGTVLQTETGMGYSGANIVFTAQQGGTYYLRADGTGSSIGYYDIGAEPFTIKALTLDPTTGWPSPVVPVASNQDGTYSETVLGNVFNDQLVGGGGDDLVDGWYGADTVAGGLGDDTLDGGSGGRDYGNDIASYAGATGAVVVNLVTGTATGGHGNDTLLHIEGAVGGNGGDLLTGDIYRNPLFGGAGNDTIDGGADGDTMNGGAGNDLLLVDDVDDVIVEAANGGVDTVGATVSHTLGANVERLYLNGTDAINGVGNALANLLVGNGAANVMNGLAGNDTMVGGLGNDTLVGAGGKDASYGGGGADTFRFYAITDSGAAAAQRDAIMDFDATDLIDLSLIDANVRVAGNQAFAFVTNFTGVAGQLQWDKVGATSFLVTGDVNGDAVADFSLQVDGIAGFTQISAGDFTL